MLIALDVDGTLFDGREIATEARAALHRAHDDGHVLMIVTGRRWEELGHIIADDMRIFSRVVCEEGGVLVDVATRDIRLLGEPVDPELVAALRAAGVPSLDVGRVVVGAPRDWFETVIEVRDRLASNRNVIVNKGSIALAPVDCDKGIGLRAAIADLARSDDSVAALTILTIGDAANDLAMFAVATIAVGVANADDAVRASGVPLTDRSFGHGVAEAIDRYVPRRPTGSTALTELNGSTHDRSGGSFNETAGASSSEFASSPRRH